MAAKLEKLLSKIIARRNELTKLLTQLLGLYQK
jgi:hypothetical protein